VRAFLITLCVIAICAPAHATDQTRKRAQLQSKSAGADRTSVLCQWTIDLTLYLVAAGPVALVACKPEGPDTYVLFEISETDPIPASLVVAFIQPYILARHQIQLMPYVTGPPPIASFNMRVSISYNKDKKIVAMGLQSYGP